MVPAEELTARPRVAPSALVVSKPRRAASSSVREQIWLIGVAAGHIWWSCSNKILYECEYIPSFKKKEETEPVF